MAVDLEYFGVPPVDYREVSYRTRFVSVSGQTTYPAPYVVGGVDVYVSGVKLDPFSQFTGTDGLNIVLSAAPTAGSIVQVISQGQVLLADTYSQTQINSLVGNFYGVCTGTGDAQVLVTVPAFTTFKDGMVIRCRAVAANSTATPTLAVNGLSAKTIVSNNANSPLVGGDFSTNNELTLRYVQAIDRFVLVDGNQNVQAPAQFDQSYRPSTTSFVKASGWQVPGGGTSINVSSTLTQSQFNGWFEVQGSYTTTLPLISTLPAGANGSTYTFRCSSAGFTLKVGGGSDYIALPNGTSVTTYTPYKGEVFTVVLNGTAGWHILSSGFSSGSYGSSFAIPGYQKLPSGLVMQWGTGSYTGNSDTTQSVSYPIAFPTAVLSVTGNIGSALGGSTIGIQNSGTTSFTVGYHSAGGASASGLFYAWIAVGY